MYTSFCFISFNYWQFMFFHQGCEILGQTSTFSWSTFQVWNAFLFYSYHNLIFFFSFTFQRFLSNLSLAQQQQLAQQLQALSLYNNSNNHSAIHVSLQQPPSYPHSPASLSSLYSSISTPPYAASSSSGRLSPTPTISSSSDYSSVPPSLQLPKMMSSASSTCSSQNSSCLRGAAATVVSSVIKTSQLQAWSARQAKSQSPVIMQSVKSTQVQKPVLQTAIAPTIPPVNSSPHTFISQNSNNGTNSTCSSSVKLATSTNQSISQPTSNANHLPPYTSCKTIISSTNNVGLESKLLPSNCTIANNPPPYPANSTNKNQLTVPPPLPPLQVSSANCPVIPPPPPYISAVQQPTKLSASTANINGYNRSCSHEDTIVSPQPPPPPPPPYPASFSSVPKESEPLSSGMIFQWFILFISLLLDFPIKKLLCLTRIKVLQWIVWNNRQKMTVTGLYHQLKCFSKPKWPSFLFLKIFINPIYHEFLIRIFLTFFI